jgi:polyisoprenoid-binding protein YceI/cytochrome c553
MKKLLKLSMFFTGVVMGALASSNALAQSNCTVDYRVANSWGSGAQIGITLTNNGPAVTSWELCWTYAGSETIPNLWDGVLTQTGQNVCVKNTTYNGNLATNASTAFGFLVNNPGTAPTNFTMNGLPCGGTGSSSSSSRSSSASSSSVSNTPARWLVDAANSTFHFVTVKKNTAGTETPENMTFTQLQGTVSSTGAAVLTIPLASISSGVDLRNTRLQQILFESQYLPSIHFSTQLDLSAIEAMAAGSTSVQTVTGNLTLHGLVKSVVFDALVVKNTSNVVSFSPKKPIIITSTDFDLNGGIEDLRVLMSLTTIGERVPVYFKMFLTRDNPTNVAAITLPAAPTAPLSLTGTAVTSGASLNWADSSNNETGFIVRRKAADGRWKTATGTAANAVSFLDPLTITGSYEYKVLSYVDSIPSVATAGPVISFVGVDGSSSSISVSSSSSSSTSVSSTSRSSSSSVSTSRSSSSSSAGALVGNAANGQSLWTSRGCIGCHGVDGEKNASGTPALQPLNANRLAYRHSMDTQERSLRDFIAMWMPQGNEGSCTGQCAADLEAYIWTWRKPSDGIPDNPSTAFSCPTTGPTYGQRTLRLLTKNEYQRSIRDLVNYQSDLISLLPDDYVAGYFYNNNSLYIDKTRYTSYISNAERIATDVATRWNGVLGCTPSTSCASTLVNTLGPRIFRRPLTTEEQTAYLAVANGTTGGRSVTDGMQVALTAMLSSPQFLYRSELGELSSGSIYKLTAHELATYMSYTFTGSTPSTTLMSAAANGSLNTVAGIRSQAATLLSSANTNLLLGDFINRWLNTEQIQTLNKPAVSNFSTLGTAMKNELSKNFSYAMLNSSTTFTDIYNPSYTHINSQLASHYGLSMSGSTDADGFARVNTSERGGILMSGAFLSRYASTTDANLVTRAVAVRRRMMCQDIPEPPSGVSLDREALAARDAAFYADPKTTQRMIFDRITAGTTCSNCHGEIINPLGGTMENFDTAGRIRSVDLKGNAIVATGTFYSPYPQLQFMNDPDRVIYSPAITLNGTKDLARIMTEHSLIASQAQTCLATQFMSYSSGIHHIFLVDSKRDVGSKRISKDEENAYRCDIANLKNVLVSSGPRAMLQEIPALNSVIYRQVWAR